MKEAIDARLSEVVTRADERHGAGVVKPAVAAATAAESESGDERGELAEIQPGGRLAAAAEDMSAVDVTDDAAALGDGISHIRQRAALEAAR